MQDAIKPTLDRGIAWQKNTKNILRYGQHMLDKHATLMSHLYKHTRHKERG
ncbi:hypothetical protein HYC85_029171 [Camellia sinensis]|uniref:Uncharacterized protein n=1 Tax=Camellia sinensis TaxID=4442 RepID=A0A7J7FX87_CAMSI|nr:hypothetical protein HYC85_029171 [Camellia sinensis]